MSIYFKNGSDIQTSIADTSIREVRANFITLAFVCEKCGRPLVETLDMREVKISCDKDTQHIYSTCYECNLKVGS